MVFRIASVFPKVDVQLCQVYQLSKSLRYEVMNDKRQVTKGLRPILYVLKLLQSLVILPALMDK